MNTVIYEKKMITGTTTLVYTGACKLHSLIVGSTVAGVIKIIDGVSGTTANVGTVMTSSAPVEMVYDCKMDSGIYIVADTANSNATVVYSASI